MQLRKADGVLASLIMLLGEAGGSPDHGLRECEEGKRSCFCVGANSQWECRPNVQASCC